MTRTLATAAAALLLLGSAGAGADELTHPRDGGSADIAFDTNLPGEADAAFTEPEYRGSDEAVDRNAVKALRRMAIEAGQTSSSSEADDEAGTEPPESVREHADSYFQRMRQRRGDSG